MVAVTDKLPLDSEEIRSPERPIRSINKNAVYVCFGVAFLAVGLIVSSLVFSAEASPNKSSSSEAKIEPATAPAEMLNQLPESYDEIDSKRAVQDAEEDLEQPSTKGNLRQGESAPDMRQGYPNAPYGSPSANYGPSPSDVEKEAAEKSGIMFAAGNSAGSDRPRNEAGSGREYASPSSGGMFFNQKSQAHELSNKEKFMQNEGSSGARQLRGPLSKYSVMQGSIVPAVLLTAINSDLPGNILAQVTTNVFDSKSGKYLLIPQGTKIVGEYNSAVSYGQQRAQIAWTRMILPNSDSVDLGRMPGVDSSGASGAPGSIDRHLDQLAIGVLVTSVLSAGAGLSQGPVNPSAVSPQQAIGQSVGQEVSRLGAKMAEKALDVQPTIKIPSGTKINVFATEDVLLKPYVYR